MEKLYGGLIMCIIIKFCHSVKLDPYAWRKSLDFKV